jgi:hypothetical protein
VALDEVLAAARRSGLRVILSLVDNWKYYNGVRLAPLPCAVQYSTAAPGPPQDLAAGRLVCWCGTR